MLAREEGGCAPAGPVPTRGAAAEGVGTVHAAASRLAACCNVWWRLQHPVRVCSWGNLRPARRSVCGSQAAARRLLAPCISFTAMGSAAGQQRLTSPRLFTALQEGGSEGGPCSPRGTSPPIRSLPPVPPPSTPQPPSPSSVQPHPSPSAPPTPAPTSPALTRRPSKILPPSHPTPPPCTPTRHPAPPPPHLPTLSIPFPSAKWDPGPIPTQDSSAAPPHPLQTPGAPTFLPPLGPLSERLPGAACQTR